MEKPIEQLEEWEWIERYWLDQLTPSERGFFEKLMQDDDRLAQEATSLRFGIQLVEEARIQANARQTIQQLRQADQRKRQTVVRWVVFAGVAAAACIACVVYLAFAPIALPARENDLDVLREFRHQYYADSTDRLSLRQKQVFDRFFEGQSSLTEGQPQLAVKRFEEVLAVPELRPYFREAAGWHLLISYLKTNQVAKAEKLYTELEAADEYGMPRLERWKIWWHLQHLAWFGPA